MKQNGNDSNTETIPVPISLEDYNLIIAEIGELIYRAACDAELKSAPRPFSRKDTLSPPPIETFLKKGDNHAS